MTIEPYASNTPEAVLERLTHQANVIAYNIRHNIYSTEENKAIARNRMREHLEEALALLPGNSTPHCAVCKKPIATPEESRLLKTWVGVHKKCP